MNNVQELFSQFGPNSAFIQELYEHYLTDPALVGEPWITFFDSLMPSLQQSEEISHGVSLEVVKKQAAVSRLIDVFRSYGHFHAKINPLTKGITPLPEHDELNLSAYGLSSADLESPFFTDGLLSEGTATLKEILSKLEDCYCGTVGFEYMHLTSREEREFLREKIEAMSRYTFSGEQRKTILQNLVAAELLEAMLHKRYVGQKRFSLEGGETVIPMLRIMLEKLSSLEAEEVRIGMPHRGRLSVLVNIAGKPLEKLFSEFEDRTSATIHGSGDVKYHLGSGHTYSFSTGKMTVSLCPNPSHLEFVNPVVEGLCRADQDFRFAGDRKKVVPVVLHGEAAFSGQGIVYETLNLSGTKGYDSGGTVHLVVNNQVGFTANPNEQRGTVYCSDLAKGIGAPVFHVNGEDIETACWVMEVASEFRQKFGRDIIVDLICYRKYGHNEGDDPSFTQPVMYSEIKGKQPLSLQYSEYLKKEGAASDEEYQALKDQFVKHFEDASEKSQTVTNQNKIERPDAKGVKTGIKKAKLEELSKALTKIPEGFTPHQKLYSLLEKRSQKVIDGELLEWGVCEGIAFASLLDEGIPIRLSGQDAGRGTFSHRHAVLYDINTGAPVVPINTISEKAKLDVHNSVLSEAAVLGFEFGYSHAAPDNLIIWEAQFGDFANGAQVHIDQFIAASEAKWNFRSGVTLLLPHGYEGQGPEHSSARIERFLQLAAENNMQVCYPSNGAQYFHLLRRQGLSDVKRPLIVMTPKSLLRLPEAGVKGSELIEGKFDPIIDEVIGQSPKVTILLTGKVYYDVVSLLKRENKSAQIIRVEELYPAPVALIKEALKRNNTKEVIWVQEEPKNMGAWSFVSEVLREEVGVEPHYCGRPRSASTAAGSGKRHAQEQSEIMKAIVSKL